VARAIRISYPTIVRGVYELDSGASAATGRVRRPGGGRKSSLAKDPSLFSDPDALVEPTASGDPESPLRWTSKSVRMLAAHLRAGGHVVSYQLVSELLADAGYSLQADRKTREGTDHPDRDEQFHYVIPTGEGVPARRAASDLCGHQEEGACRRLQEHRKTVVSEADPTDLVRVHDFIIPEKGKAITHGVYDLTRNTGWVSVGIDHDTASFAARTILLWWRKMGQPVYPRASRLLITADAGGSNGPRVRLWKREVQRLAKRISRAVTRMPLPTGNEQMEQDRASSVLVRHQLARPTTDQPRSDCQSDSFHANGDSPSCASRA
jgi:Rhodopirellula transposase DDE domain